MSPPSSANHSVGQTIRYTAVHQNESNPANMQESASVPLHLAEDSTAFAEGQKNQEAVSENKMSLAASSTRSTNGQRIMLAGWDWILEYNQLD
ncbi:unnamed protein product [Alternaria alternata]